MRLRLLGLILLLALAFAVCSVKSSGLPVPHLPADFSPGSTIPGWIQTLPQAGRAEVAAQSVHTNGRWSVVFSRPLASRPRDLRFSIAIMDDGVAHVGKPLIRFTSDPSVFPISETVVCREVPDGHVIPDGTMSPGEWSPVDLSLVTLTPEDDLPAGRYPATTNLDVTVGSAYDSEYVYFVFQWADPSGTRSDLGPLLEWDGTVWRRRPHRANDVNGNGLLDPGETATFTASAEDEDRLALFFPIHDETGAFRTGAQGCTASCHQNLALDPTGAEAVHAWQRPNDLTDVWVWRAASTAPGRTADDRVLGFANAAAGLSGGGSGFADDAGAPPFVAQDPLNPGTMFAAPENSQTFLVQGPLSFGPTTVPGFPVIPTVPNTAAPFAAASFNGTGSPPTPWTGVPPLFGNNYLPPFVQRMATNSRADVETGSSFSAGVWTVEFRRRRVTRDVLGDVRTDDVQFDEDAAFKKEGFEVTTAANGLPFSVSITDHAAGHGTRETRYEGPLRMSRDETLTGPVLGGDLLLHDYGPGFAPASAADFTDSRHLAPVPAAGADLHLSMKAGTNGGQSLFVLAEWDDPTIDASRDLWSFDGFFWTQSGSEDEFRLLWNATIPRAAFTGASGCAYLCHGAGGPLGAPPGPHFSTTGINQTADLWRWMAGRGGPIGFADDQTVDWRFFELFEGGVPGAAIHGDAGRAPFLTNADPARGYPLFMAPTDPNANATFLTLGVPGFPDAVSFRDVLFNLPPAPPTGGGTPSFANDVLPIFMNHCLGCHPPFANLDLQSYAGVLAGGQSGLVVVPGNPSSSLIIKRLLGQVQPQMPLGGPYLTPAQIQSISDWIAAGAPNN